MSYNQVRTDKIEGGQLRKSGGRGRGFLGGGRSGCGGGVAASRSTNQRYKKSSNGQVWQPRMVHSNLGSETSVASATPGAVQNGAPGPPYSQGDETKPFSLQSGTISPGIVNGLQVPVRTSSAPPNFDEQKQNRVQHNSFRAGPTQPIPSIPKQPPPQPRNEGPASNFSSGESRPLIQQVKREVQVASQMLNIIQQVKDVNIDNAPIQQVKRGMHIAHQMLHIIQQVKEVNIDNAVTLAGVVSQIFDKALMEPTFCELYANFCFHLSYVLPDFMEDGEKITFKRLLVNKCQEEFERVEREEAEAKRVEEEVEIKQTDEEREEKRSKARRRMLGNICLIGELYKMKMLAERIMHECIQKLLGEHQTPDEENLEALCKLMSTIGYQIDHAKTRNFMDSYFESMLKLSTNINLSSRIRFMLRDIIDLRKNRWQQRRKVEGPKKIEEVQRERQSQTSRLTHGPIGQGSSSRAGSIVKSDRFTNAVQRCYDLLAPIIAVQRWEFMLIFCNEPLNLDIVEILDDEDIEGFMLYELDLLHRRQ